MTDAELERLTPGVRLSMKVTADSQAESVGPKTQRLAAWRFDPGELRGLAGISRPKPTAVELIAEGFVFVPQRGRFRFSVEGTQPCVVTIGEQIVWRSQLNQPLPPPGEVELVRGYNKLRIVQTVEREQLEKPVSLRLLWSADAFETEPIPPTSLFCFYERLPEKVVHAKHGRGLFMSYQCFRCHRVSDDVFKASTAMPELHAEAPDFIGAGARLRSDWIYAWMLNPAMKKAHTRMPRLFPLDLTDEHFQDASDIAEYVGSLRGEELPQPKSEGDLRQGKRLWEELGCIGCHQLTPQSSDLKPKSEELYSSLPSRTTLIDLKTKYHPAGLRSYLAKPHQHFAWNPMPDFQLAPHEVESLALLLEETTTESREHFTGRLKGDPDRGKKLFEQYRCGQCHRVASGQPLSPPYLPTVFGVRIAKGCLTSLDSDTDLDQGLQFPKYSFSHWDQNALMAALSKSEGTLAADSATDISRRLVDQLRCQVCHARDGESSWLPEVLAEESETGKPPEIVPNLTWAGEKLHSSWTANLLRGQFAERSRPWLRIRMPSFPAHARWLADGLAHEHGLSSEPEPRPSVTPELVPIGEVLAARAGMLDCRQCHALGELPPTGDKNTLLAPGINFAQTRERIRFDFYRRFTLDPPKYDVTTRMPKLAADGRTTKITNVLDGDARRQFEAVWHFLQTVPSSTADP